MRLFLFFTAILLFISLSCAERKKLPLENRDLTSQVENNPVVVNRLNYFEFQIDAESFYFISQYPIDFNSEAIRLEISVQNYRSGAGNLTMQNESGSQAYSQTLTGNRAESTNLLGVIAPVSVRLDFTNYDADIVITLSLN